MKRLMILVALLVATTAQAAPTSEQCSAAANISVYALEVRQNGLPEDVVLAYLRTQGAYSGLPVWAVKSAYDAPLNIKPWILKGLVLGECRKRDA